MLPRKNSRAPIFWGAEEIEPWNPFCLDEDSTQPYTDEGIDFGDEIVNIQGYVLPHKEEFKTERAYKEAEGLYGYTAMQGFYVYRGKRLLLAGDWLGLFRKEEHYKLVRIQIDLPNTLDTMWQIDIKKSTAIPPLSCREYLKVYAKKVRQMGLDVYKHKGRIIQHRAGKKFQSIWNERKEGKKISFVVNRKHAFVTSLKEMAKTEPSRAIDLLLTFVEESIPTKSIYIKEAENEEQVGTEPSENLLKGLEIMAKRLYQAKRKMGTPAELIKEELKQTAPFHIFQDIIDNLND